VCLTVGWGSPSATFSSGCVLVCFLPWLHGVVSFLFDVFGENFVVSYSVLFQLLLPFPPTFGFRRTTCSRLALSDRTLRLSSISLTEQTKSQPRCHPAPHQSPLVLGTRHMGAPPIAMADNDNIHRSGVSGRLKPPGRFMYCRCLRNRRTFAPLTSVPSTCLPCVYSRRGSVKPGKKQHGHPETAKATRVAETKRHASVSIGTCMAGPVAGPTTLVDSVPSNTRVHGGGRDADGHVATGCPTKQERNRREARAPRR